VEMMLEEKDLPGTVKSVLEIIDTQATRIRKLVDRLLKFSRKTPLKFEVINLNDTIEGVLSLLSYHKLPTAQIYINKNLEKNLPAIRGDVNQLQEVLVNLCVNAYQSMSENGGTLSIKTSNFKNLHAEVKISDTGCGIAEQDLKNIFIPFFSTKKDGTGLGLSICFNIIKNHSGIIDVESQLGKGTVFIIKLPFAKG
jgi:two-component system NtrC family sensor kinase